VVVPHQAGGVGDGRGLDAPVGEGDVDDGAGAAGREEAAAGRRGEAAGVDEA